MDGVEDGTIQITDEDFPSFLYETDRIYDEANEDIGLFRGYLLVRVFRHIFTGPLSALNPNMKSNKFKAKKFKLTSVTGRTIAYACVQVRNFSFSTSSSQSNYLKGLHRSFIHEPMGLM